MEIGALKAENEGLVKRSEEARVKVLNLEDMIQVASVLVHIEKKKQRRCFSFSNPNIFST